MKLCKLLLAPSALPCCSARLSRARPREVRIQHSGFRAVFRRVEFNTPEGTITCEFTLEGSLHERTMVKSLGTLMGYITRADLRHVCDRHRDHPNEHASLARKVLRLRG